VFARTDFSRLALKLSRISGRFMISVNDFPQMREVFKQFLIETLETRYTVSGKWSDVQRSW
jgi:DNA adenine methylase